MALVLAIEPDARQREALRGLTRERVPAELVLVDSTDAALAAVNGRTPDLILVTALLSPRDEAELMAHLRALDDATHLQTLTIPRLASPADRRTTLRQRVGGFMRRDLATPTACDPSVFVEEILCYLGRAREVKAEREVVGEWSLATGRADGPPAREAEPVQDAAGLVAPCSDESAIRLSEEGWPPLEVRSTTDDVPAAVGEPSLLETSDQVVAPALPATLTPPDDEQEEETSLGDQNVGLEAAVAGEFGEAAQLDDAQQVPVDVILDRAVEEADPVRETAVPVQSGASAAETNGGEWLRARIDDVSRVLDQPPAREESSELPQPVALARLAPLAIWARQEAEPRPLATTQPDDLRALLSRLAVPLDVASVTYPRGCRIRRVRIEGTRPKRRKGAVAGPIVILSGSIRSDVSRTTAR